MSTDTVTSDIAVQEQADSSDSPVRILSANNLLVLKKVCIIADSFPDGIVESENEMFGMDRIE